jgi:branched-chain amino acid transport system ATP-binding protein
MTLLEVKNLDAGYGQFQALFDVSLNLKEGEAISVIGANGAGKSTLLKAIAGTVNMNSGDVLLDGKSICDMQPHERLLQGIALVPEGRRIFRSLTVKENLLIGGYSSRSGSWNVASILEAFPILENFIGRDADRLSGGEQQALAIGRALMSNPRVLLLDEVSLGLAPIVVKQLYAALPIIRNKGCALVIVEQDTNQALAASDHTYCMLEGRISLEGKPSELTREQISQAYFGLGAHA